MSPGFLFVASLWREWLNEWVIPWKYGVFHVHVYEAAITFKAPEKKSRPLSATRRAESIDKVDVNAEEIFKAMAEENQTVGESKYYFHIFE